MFCGSVLPASCMPGTIYRWDAVATSAAVCRYLRNRELVLATYLVLSAAVTAYRAHRETLPLEPQSALASLVWFSRAQSAEPLMLKSIIFAVRPPAHRNPPRLLRILHQKEVSRRRPWLLRSQSAHAPSLQVQAHREHLSRQQSSFQANSQSQDLVYMVRLPQRPSGNQRLMNSPPDLLLSCLLCCSCASEW